MKKQDIYLMKRGLVFDKNTPQLVLSVIDPPINILAQRGIVWFKHFVPIELISTSDPYTRLKSGAIGKATGWNKQDNNIYALFVDWEGGSNLSLVYKEDKWKVIDE